MGRRNHRIDALVLLDAYSVDEIPTHLLTREALQLYLRNLAGDGILAFHITNNFFDLRPVLGNLAAAEHLAAYARGSEGNGSSGVFPAQWAVLARHRGDLGTIPSDQRWKALQRDARIPLWTDDYSSEMRILKPRAFF